MLLENSHLDNSRLCAQTDESEPNLSFAEHVMTDNGGLGHTAALAALAVITSEAEQYENGRDTNLAVVVHINDIIEQLTQFRDAYKVCWNRAVYEDKLKRSLCGNDYESIAACAGVLNRLSKEVNGEAYELFKSCITKEGA